jgi:hypothetical protein
MDEAKFDEILMLLAMQKGALRPLALELVTPQPTGGAESAFKVRLSTQKAIIFRNKIEQRVRELSANPAT